MVACKWPAVRRPLFAAPSEAIGIRWVHSPDLPDHFDSAVSMESTRTSSDRNRSGRRLAASSCVKILTLLIWTQLLGIRAWKHRYRRVYSGACKALEVVLPDLLYRSWRRPDAAQLRTHADANEAWQRGELTDVTVKVVIYEAFV